MTCHRPKASTDVLGPPSIRQREQTRSLRSSRWSWFTRRLTMPIVEGEKIRPTTHLPAIRPWPYRSSVVAKSILFCTGIAGATAFLPAPVQAIGFTGYYATSNWTINAPSNATITISGTAPNNTIILSSKNNGGGLSNTTFTITADPSAAVASTVSFNWSYLTEDVDGSTFDPFGYVLNGNFFQLTANGRPRLSTQSGTARFLVQPGDVFGFNQRSTDSQLGRGITNVSGFSIVAVPSLPSLFGLLPLALVARRRYSRRSQ